MKRILFILVIFSSGNVMADSVVDMCRDSDTICACAAGKLRSEVNDDDYNLYETIGAAYITNKSNGMATGDAWDAAVNVAADEHGSSYYKILNKTNSIGKAHRKAISTCSD